MSIKRTPEEIKKAIASVIVDDKKYSKETFDVVISSAFIPTEIQKAKRMKSSIDSEIATNQDVSFSSDIKTNAFNSLGMLSSLFYKSNWFAIIKTILFTMFVSFFAYGIFFAFIPTDALVMQNRQVQVGVGVYFSFFILPMFLFVFWAFSEWIIKLRSDNLIARLRIRGLTKIQFILFSYLLVVGTFLLLEILIMFIWFPLINTLSMSLSGPKDNEFYLIENVSIIMVIIKLLIFVTAIFNIALIVGFYIPSKKVHLNIVLGLFIFTLVNYLMDFKTYGNYGFETFGSMAWFGKLVVSIRWLNPVYSTGNHLLTTLIPSVSENSLGHFDTGLYKTWFELIMNLLMITLTITFAILTIWYSKVVIKYKPLS